MATAYVRESPSPKQPEIRFRIPPFYIPQILGDETHILTPENGWLEYDCFLLGPDLISICSFQGG